MRAKRGVSIQGEAAPAGDDRPICNAIERLQAYKRVMTAGLLFGLNAVLNLILMLALARAMPAEAYGSLATWTAGVFFLTTAVFDWVRFSAMRFYTPHSRDGDPAVRATLDLAFLISTLLAAALVFAATTLRLLPGLTGTIALALVVLTVGNAAFEYLAALARNLSNTRVYAWMIALRHGSILICVVPVAALTRDAAWTLGALALTIWPGVILGASALAEAGAKPSAAAADRAAQYLGYGLPLIAAEALFQGVSLINRAWLAATVGLAAAGAYALTFDLAFKVMAVVASMGEAALLPRLVRQDAPDAAPGPALTRNIALMLLLTVPAAVAFLVLARPFAQIALAPDFRPGFLAAVGFGVGAAALYAFQTYVLRPAFQMSLKTAPLAQAALLALAIDGVGLFALKAHGAAGVMTAHGLGLAAGAALLLGRVLIGLKVRWPVLETLKIALAGALMGAAGWSVAADVASAPLAILAAGAAMAAAVGLSAVALDIAGGRGLLIRAAARTGMTPFVPPGVRARSGLR
jgi:O-antigen/teichoic acid export membrane protein